MSDENLKSPQDTFEKILEKAASAKANRELMMKEDYAALAVLHDAYLRLKVMSAMRLTIWQRK